ncbi:hypothetical protein GGI03_007443 [Coemansia sp. RSA 2337]|nr:hypothetical protein GGI03_007443 [Coemansia sp. RSA 2337]
MQRQREAQLSGSVAGTQMPTTGAPIQQQQQLQQQQLQQMQQQQQQPSALAVLQQRQQQINLAAMAARGGAGGSAAMINPAGVVPTIQTPIVRPMQQPGATVAPQSRPAAPMMTSPANVPQVMTAAQRQVLQQNALANMTPQQQQEVYMRMQQARQQAAMAPQQQPQISVAMVVQQLLAGQINPEQLPPQAISILWQSAQSHMNPEQRMALQRILSSRVQQIQNNAAQAGAVRPGAAQ